MNGIIFHPDGYLLAGDYVRSKLWHIPTDKPQDFHEVRLPAPLTGPDGLRLIAPDTLVAVQAAFDAEGKMRSAVTFMRSTYDWQSEKIADNQPPADIDGATMATLKDDKL